MTKKYAEQPSGSGKWLGRAWYETDALQNSNAPPQEMNISKQYLLQVVSSHWAKYPEAGARERKISWEGANETSKGRGMGRGIRLGCPGECHELPSRVRGGAQRKTNWVRSDSPRRPLLAKVVTA